MPCLHMLLKQKNTLFHRNLILGTSEEFPKMVMKVITNIDSSKVSGPDCIYVVVLRNCEPELSYILAEFLNMCLKESCFPDC